MEGLIPILTALKLQSDQRSQLRERHPDVNTWTLHDANPSQTSSAFLLTSCHTCKTTCGPSTGSRSGPSTQHRWDSMGVPSRQGVQQWQAHNRQLNQGRCPPTERHPQPSSSSKSQLQCHCIIPSAGSRRSRIVYRITRRTQLGSSSVRKAERSPARELENIGEEQVRLRDFVGQLSSTGFIPRSLLCDT